jgi:hypothetical protein
LCFPSIVFEQAVVGASLDAYHYSYPPVLLLLTTPLARMAHVPALLAWLAAVGTLSIAHCVWRCRAKARCCSRRPRRRFSSTQSADRTAPGRQRCSAGA